MKKVKEKIGKKEFIFNLISFIILGILTIGYGSRLIYWFIYEQTETERRNNTLLYYLEAKFDEEEHDFYKDKDEFYFKNDTEYNYVNYSNNIYRIISVNDKGEIKMVLDENVATFMYGNDLSYEKSNINLFLDKTDMKNNFYSSLINPEDHLAKTSYTVDTLKSGEIVKSTDLKDVSVSTLTLEDYINTGASEGFLNNGTYFWLLGLDENGNNLYVNSSGNIESDYTYASYGVRAVITLKTDAVLLRGKGEKDNPFFIDVEDEITYINQYVKLGEDTYKIIEENNDTLKLAATDYLKEAEISKLYKYSNYVSTFDETEKGSLAYYLNNDYYNTLSYKDDLVNCTFNTGSVSDLTNNLVTNTNISTKSLKIGLMDIFNINTLDLTNYYFMNDTGLRSDTQYVNNELGYLQKAQVLEEKNIVPVVCINKESIKDGSGASYSPYKLVLDEE